MKRERRPEDVSFGKRLRRFREALGLSRKELAAFVHVSPDTIAVYENGWRGPSREVLQRLADALGVRTDALLGSEPEEQTLKALHLRRGKELIGRADTYYENLLELFEFREWIEQSRLPTHVRSHLMRAIAEAIQEYEALQDKDTRDRS
ncbi:helix-turn-helix domain-containing protein [Thermomicrobium sp. CFH 73360]|uniref:helix-turn-helix domain-containing protein n=1 Tax=Thermomicrobium sp. CFH 73360 TaxID=2951987 RepID=UPI0020774A07|nr:XRE family transcriptional regulator [Thermomicrobium sp. CFH 73360]MCM8746826.1 helix-turn-helix domain-containing protein [Thermomicrobium sp. CFH 73360]